MFIYTLDNPIMDLHYHNNIIVMVVMLQTLYNVLDNVRMTMVLVHVGTTLSILYTCKPTDQP